MASTVKGVPVTDTQKSCGCHTLTIDCDGREGCQKIIERITDADYAAAPQAPAAPVDPSHRALIKHAIRLLRLRQPVAPDVERVACDLELMLAGHETPAGAPSAAWLEVAAIAEKSPAAPDVAMQNYDDVLIPFLSMMRAELHANAGKGDRPGWLRMDAKTALLEIYYHLGKLQKATKGGDPDGIREFSADVANMAMMLADICGVLSEHPSPAAPDVADADDAAFAEDFLQWWESQGSLCRSGGGEYERAFAFEAWRHLYPKTLQAGRAAPDVAGLVGALRAADEYLSNNKLNEIGSGSILHRRMQDALAAHQKRETSHDE